MSGHSRGLLFFVNGAIALIVLFFVTLMMEPAPQVNALRALIGVGLVGLVGDLADGPDRGRGPRLDLLAGKWERPAAGVDRAVRQKLINALRHYGSLPGACLLTPLADPECAPLTEFYPEPFLFLESRLVLLDVIKGGKQYRHPPGKMLAKRRISR